MNILFHAINGGGLGHVVRLSIISNYLKQSNCRHRLFFFSNSPAADRYFDCEGVVWNVENESDVKTVQQMYNEFERYIDDNLIDVVVFDTHWPRPLTRKLKDSGIKTVLILRALEPGHMLLYLKRAFADFNQIFIPHDAFELTFHYSNDAEIMRYINSGFCTIIGPIARTRTSDPLTTDSVKIIFALGAGGEYRRATAETKIDSYLLQFSKIAEWWNQTYGLNSYFAQGPYLKSTDVHGLHAIQTDRLYEYFDMNTIVITRGGYNTSFEALASGAFVIFTGLYKSAEDIFARADYFEHYHYGAATELTTDDIKSKINAFMVDKNRHQRREVNAGLALLVQSISDEVNLFYDRNNNNRLISDDQFILLKDTIRPNYVIKTRHVPSAKQLIARFDDVYSNQISNAEIEQIFLANQLGYRTQVHIQLDNASDTTHPVFSQFIEYGCELWLHGIRHVRGYSFNRHEFELYAERFFKLFGIPPKGISIPYDENPQVINENAFEDICLSLLHYRPQVKNLELCVDIHSWPGPRLRNDIQVLQRLYTAGKLVTDFGLCFHPKKTPTVVTNYFLQTFKLF